MLAFLSARVLYMYFLKYVVLDLLFLNTGLTILPHNSEVQLYIVTNVLIVCLYSLLHVMPGFRVHTIAVTKITNCEL